MKSVYVKSRLEAQKWVQSQNAAIQRPCVILLSGELGAGKTQFVRWFLEEQGAKDVASPTFAIHHEYESPNGLIDHVDLYRVKDDSDLEAAGFWDLFLQERGLVLVEWADRLPADVWPRHWRKLKIDLHKDQDEARRIEFEVRKD